jgi:hypothetical protein
MDYKQYAQKLAKQGRYGDTMLMHVNPKEVAGLNYLGRKYGTGVTINPKTGLPEAFNFMRLLPVIAGAALAPYTGGATAGMIVGGVETARTGSLSKGLQAGLGAFGGANLAGNIGQMGAEQAVAEQTAANLANTTQIPMAAPTGADVLAAQQPGQLESFISQQAGGAKFTPDAILLPGNEVQSVALTPDQIAANEAYTKAGQQYGEAAYKAARPEIYGADFKPTYGDIGRGFERLGTVEGLSSASANVMADPMSVGKTVGSLALGTQEEQEPPQRPERDFSKYPKAEPYRRNYVENPNPRSDREFSYYQPNALYVNKGGITRLNVGGLAGGYTDYMRQLQLMLNKKGMGDATLPGSAGTPMQTASTGNAPQSMNKMKAYKAGGSVPMLEDGGFVLRASTVNGVGNGSSEAGMKYLQAKLGAVPIRGKGDGTKDQIATSIEGRRKALLSNEEAYVPRSVVAQLGNGDVNKGAKKLDEFMKKVDKARTGKAKPPKTINPDKLVPKKTKYA